MKDDHVLVGRQMASYAINHAKCIKPHLLDPIPLFTDEKEVRTYVAQAGPNTIACRMFEDGSVMTEVIDWKEYRRTNQIDFKFLKDYEPTEEDIKNFLQIVFFCIGENIDEKYVVKLESFGSCVLALEHKGIVFVGLPSKSGKVYLRTIEF